MAKAVRSVAGRSWREILCSNPKPLRPPASLRGTLRVAKWLKLREVLRAGLGVFYFLISNLYVLAPWREIFCLNVLP